MTGKEIPNPGSDEALDMGCECPVMDNGYGKRPPPFWITMGCPVHMPRQTDGDEREEANPC